MHYLRSILFIAAVVTLTVVVSLTVPFMWLFNAGSPAVRAVSQVWAKGIMLLFRVVLGLDYREYGRDQFPTAPASSPAIISRCGRPRR